MRSNDDLARANGLIANRRSRFDDDGEVDFAHSVPGVGASGQTCFARPPELELEGLMAP